MERVLYQNKIRANQIIRYVLDECSNDESINTLTQLIRCRIQIEIICPRGSEMERRILVAEFGF